MTKKLYKTVLLAALGLGGITAAQAQDALLGFNDAAGPSGAQNDYVIDLGAGSQFTPTATLNLSSLFSASTFTTAFNADASYLNNVAAGFVMGYNGTLDQSLPSASPVGTTPSNTLFNNSEGAAQAGIPAIVQSSATANGWSAEIAQSPTSGGSIGAPSLGVSTGNPMGTLSSGVLSLEIYQDTANSYGNRNQSQNAWTDLGTLAMNANSGTVTFTGVSAVPEPATYGLFASAGLLIVALRHKLSRKQA